VKRKATRKATRKASRKRNRLSGARKYAIARVLISGVPASHLAKLFGVSQLSVYSWAKAVKKAKGKNPFNGQEDSYTPKQKRLLAQALKTK